MSEFDDIQPEALAVAESIIKNFVGRTDELSCTFLFTGSQDPVRPVLVADFRELLYVIVSHVAGRTIVVRYRVADEVRPTSEPIQLRAGTYLHWADRTTRTVVFDEDGDSHPNPASRLTDPDALARAIIAAASEFGLVVHTAKSRSATGFHQWVPFDAAVPLTDARNLGLALGRIAVAACGARCADGKAADPGRSKGIEVRPSSADAPYGKPICLPLPFDRSRPDGGMFGTFRNDCTFETWPVFPPSFARNPREAVEVALVKARRRFPDLWEPPARVCRSDDSWITLDHVRQMLDTVPNDGGRSDWIRIGMAINSSFPGEDGFDVWEAWSKTTHSGRTCEANWRSFKEGGAITIATLIREALDHGWSLPPEAQTTRSDLDDLAADLAAIRDKTQAEAETLGLALPKDQAGAPSASRTAPAVLTPASPARPTWRRPFVRVTHEDANVVANAVRLAVQDRNAVCPRLFLLNGVAVEVRHGRIRPLRVTGWATEIDEAVVCMRVEKTYETPVTCPKWLSERLWERPPALPILNGLTHVPQVAADGFLLRPGYNPSSGIWYEEPPDLSGLTVADFPTGAEVAAARDRLLDVVVDFRFATTADRIAWLATVIAQFCNLLIVGPKPFGYGRGPVQSVGKTLVFRALMTLVQGSASVTTIGRKNADEEIRKKITSFLMEGRDVAILDNLHNVDSDALSVLATSTRWVDRALSTNNVVDVEHHLQILITANNATISADTLRRLLPVTLTTDQEEPWREKRTFAHGAGDLLLAWIRGRRRELVADVLTLVRSWLLAGASPGGRSLGSFESWAAVVGGILEHAGVRDFLGNLDEFHGESTSEALDMRALVEVWTRSTDATRWITANELMGLIDPRGANGTTTDPALDAARATVLARLTTGTGQPQQRLGNVLTRARGRVVNGYRIVVGVDSHANVRRFRLEPIRTTSEGCEGCENRALAENTEDNQIAARAAGVAGLTTSHLGLNDSEVSRNDVCIGDGTSPAAPQPSHGPTEPLHAHAPACDVTQGEEDPTRVRVNWPGSNDARVGRFLPDGSFEMHRADGSVKIIRPDPERGRLVHLGWSLLRAVHDEPHDIGDLGDETRRVLIENLFPEELSAVRREMTTGEFEETSDYAVGVLVERLVHRDPARVEAAIEARDRQRYGRRQQVDRWSDQGGRR